MNWNKIFAWATIPVALFIWWRPNFLPSMWVSVYMTIVVGYWLVKGVFK